jgi:Fur family transcriptional regulator, ferric uptake regulator
LHSLIIPPGVRLTAIDLHLCERWGIIIIMKEKIDTKQMLKKAGLKVTPGRVAILNILAASANPQGVKDISGKMGSAAVDLATLYRTVNSMVEKGLLRQIDFKQGFAYYELIEDRHHHHHLVCKDCSKVVDLESCDYIKLDKQALKRLGFARVDEHVLEFFGRCANCEGKKR